MHVMQVETVLIMMGRSSADADQDLLFNWMVAVASILQNARRTEDAVMMLRALNWLGHTTANVTKGTPEMDILATISMSASTQWLIATAGPEQTPSAPTLRRSMLMPA